MNREQFLSTIAQTLEDNGFVSIADNEVWKNCEYATSFLLNYLDRIPTPDEIEDEISCYVKAQGQDPHVIASQISKNINMASDEINRLSDSMSLDAFLDPEPEEVEYVCPKCASKDTEKVFDGIDTADVVCYECGEEFQVDGIGRYDEPDTYSY